MREEELSKLFDRERLLRQQRMLRSHEFVATSREVLQDLERVGSQKPLGNLPIQTLLDLGEDPQVWVAKAQENGLLAKIYPRFLPGGRISGAIAIADPVALEHVLQRNDRVLELFNWPTDPQLFMDRVHQEQVSMGNPVYSIIAQAFADNQPIPLRYQIQQRVRTASARVGITIRRTA